MFEAVEARVFTFFKTQLLRGQFIKGVHNYATPQFLKKFLNSIKIGNFMVLSTKT